jgi:hypothetical protein
MSFNHYEVLNKSIENLHSQAEKLQSLTEIYRKTDEINEHFAQNLAEFSRLKTAWENFFSLQEQKFDALKTENSLYFREFDKLRQETAQLTAQAQEILRLFDIRKKETDEQLAAFASEVNILRKSTETQIQEIGNNAGLLLHKYSEGLQKLTALENNFAESEQKNNSTLAVLEKNIALVRSEIAAFLQNNTAQVLEKLEFIGNKNKEIGIRFEQMMHRSEAENAQALLNLSQKTDEMLARLERLFVQSLSVLDAKTEKNMQFSQNQLLRTEELFRDTQIRAEEKNVFFAKQISDSQEINSRFAASADEKIDKIAGDNRKFYGDLENAMRVRTEQLQTEFQLKVREELENHIRRSDQTFRTQLVEFQNNIREKSESRFRDAESKFYLLLLALGLNLLAILFLIFTK